MNKQILFKTLLPISTIVLFGAGLSLAIVLTSCDDEKVYELKYNNDDVENYLRNHKQNCVANTFSVEGGTLGEDYFDFLINNYNKQAFINGLVTQMLLEGGNWFELDVGKNYVHALYAFTSPLHLESVKYTLVNFKSFINYTMLVEETVEGIVQHSTQYSYYPEGASLVTSTYQEYEFDSEPFPITKTKYSSIYDISNFRYTSPFDFEQLTYEI